VRRANPETGEIEFVPVTPEEFERLKKEKEEAEAAAAAADKKKQ